MWSSPLLDFLSKLGEDECALLNLPDVTPPNKEESAYCAHHPFALEEVYVFLVELLDILFLKAGAKYMDFPGVMTQLEEKVFSSSRNTVSCCLLN